MYKTTLVFTLTSMLVFALLLGGCTVPDDMLSFGSTRTASVSHVGVSLSSPVAKAVLVQIHEENNESILLPVDTESGLPIANLEPVRFGAYNFHALSPDGRLLATIAYPSYERTMRGSLLLTDLETWTTVTTTVPISNIMFNPVFSPDGSRLALVREHATAIPEHRLQIVEIHYDSPTAGDAKQTSARRLGESEPLGLNPALYAFSADGRSIHLYGSRYSQAGMYYNPEVRVATYSAETLEPQWEQTLDTVLDGQYITKGEQEQLRGNYWDPHIGIWWQPGRAFSSDGNRLYLVHANEERMTTVDFAREQATVHRVQRQVGLLERILTWTARPAHAKILNGTQLEAALNHDGSTIYVTGREMHYSEENNFNMELLPLRIIDTSEGRLIAEGERGTIVQHSDIDMRVFLAVHDLDAVAYPTPEWTVIADPATGATLETVDEWTLLPARRLDGAAILLGSRNANNWGRELAIINPETYAPTHVEVATYPAWSEWITP